MKKETLVAGVDEAGRGPLAGPLVVAGVSASPLFLKEVSLDRDSKRLSPQKRQEWFEFIKTENKRGSLIFNYDVVSVEVLDDLGLTSSLSSSVSCVLDKLSLEKEKDFILLDGNLKAPKDYFNQETIIKGDETVVAISLASIIAKVVRDQIMINLSELYSEYGFDRHKGYATREHYLSLLRYGRCPVHRKSFTRFLD